MRANIYIRKENEKKWADIADKSVWINALLANSDDTKEYGAVKKTSAGKVVQVLKATVPDDDVKPEELSYRDKKCPVHDTTLALAGYCMVPGCKHGEKNA